MVGEYAATTYHSMLKDIIHGLSEVVEGFDQRRHDELLTLLASLKQDEEACRAFDVVFQGRTYQLRIGFHAYGTDSFGQRSAEINIAAEPPLLGAVEQFIESVILRGD